MVWLGHSSYFVQLGCQRILIDPVFSANAAPISVANRAFEGYTADDIPEIDALLISHDHYDHYDHLDYSTAQALQSKVQQVIVGLGVGAHFERWSYDTGSHFAEIGQRLGPFDLVALDAGQYDPRWTNVHINPEQAAQAADDLRTHALMQAHVGRFSIVPHNWDTIFIPMPFYLSRSVQHSLC